MLVPRQDLGTLIVTGPDRLEWLQGVLTCDTAELAPGGGRWGLVLTKPGKIMADVLVVAHESAVYLGLVRTAAPSVLAWLSGFLIMEDADIADASAENSWLELHGERAGEVASRVVAALGGALGAVDTTGSGGAAVVVPGAAVEEACASAEQAGATRTTDEEWLRFRILHGIPLYGIDIDEQRNPHEASLERRCISWTKGCYLGQEAVCMLDMRGKVKRRMVVLRVEGRGAPALGTAVHSGDLAVGDTKSAASGGPGEPPFALALALVGEPFSAPGTRLTVGGAAAEVITRGSLAQA
jgi:folate-binding protein YgfZ